MNRREFLKTAALGGAALVSGMNVAKVFGAETSTNPAATQPAAQQFANPFDAPGQWYKANLHTHTTVSDGKLTPVQRVAQYRQAGYDVLLITDHLLPKRYKGKLDMTGLNDGKMLVISGMEYHPHDQYPDSYHLLAINVPYPFTFSEPENPNQCIQEVAAAGGITWLGHPYWCGFQFDRVAPLKGLAAVEVYNYGCDVTSGSGVSDSEWSFMLNQGWHIPCMAVDDAHSADGKDSFGGWTMLKMPALTTENVITAITTGCCYASAGPQIKDFRIQDGEIKIVCPPAARIDFMGAPGKGRRLTAKNGNLLETAEAKPGPKMKFVRAIVTDAQGRSAWTQPIWL